MDERLMVRCKEASTVISTSVLPEKRTHRWAVAVHLAICPDCRAFRRQVRAIGAAARDAATRFDAELPADFPARIAGELVRRDNNPE
jgi:hypothetical protein